MLCHFIQVQDSSLYNRCKLVMKYAATILFNIYFNMRTMFNSDIHKNLQLVSIMSVLFAELA